ncbi:hypothetical protein H9P43_003687 [Blastocladiella emersonii ATCC 22665]|nr:hypothetical protein H9P43_003687 [Blastocladiella emersonii ATCC 22665]
MDPLARPAAEAVKTPLLNELGARSRSPSPAAPAKSSSSPTTMGALPTSNLGPGLPSPAAATVANATSSRSQPGAALDLTLVTLMGRRQPVRVYLADARDGLAPSPDLNSPRPHADGNVVVVEDAATRKRITTLYADTTLSVTRAARGGTPLPRVACRDRLAATAAALAACPRDDAGAQRSVAVHVLRPTVYPRPATGVDTRHPRFETWTFAASSAESARSARHLLREWLAVDRPCDAAYLVVVNPNAGKRHGSRILHKLVSPLLQIAMVRAEIVVTRGVAHTQEIAREANLAAYRGALMVGGDGIVHEFLNGLLERVADRDTARRFPVAHVAAGTGNGLAASLNAVPAEYAVLAAVKEWARPMDMLEYRITPIDTTSGLADPAKARRGFIHLSFTHAFIADLDIDSEVLRVLGPLRTDVFALWCIFRQATYGLRIAYVKPADHAAATAMCPSSASSHLDTPRDAIFHSPAKSGWTVLPPDAYKVVNVHNLAHLSVEFNGAPRARLNDGLARLVYTTSISPTDLLGCVLDQPSGAIVENPAVHDVPCTALVIEPMHPTRPAVFADHFRNDHAAGASSSSADLLAGTPGLTRDDPKWKKCRPRGHMVVDGELEAFGDARLAVHRGLCAVFSPRDLDERMFAAKLKAPETADAVPSPLRMGAWAGDEAARGREAFATGVRESPARSRSPSARRAEVVDVQL